MKLYTRQQMVKMAVAGVFAGGILVFSFMFFGAKKNNTVQESTVAETETETGDFAGEIEQSVVRSSEKTTVSSGSASYTQDEEQNISVYDKCNEAVVNITTQEMGLNWFLEPVVSEGGSGSGSIIDSRGYVVTNVHVIDKASKITISLYDGTSYEGQVIGKDVESDIAVLKFNPPENAVLKTIEFGDSDKLKVGQKVSAIGNPFGLAPPSL